MVARHSLVPRPHGRREILSAIMWPGHEAISRQCFGSGRSIIGSVPVLCVQCITSSFTSGSLHSPVHYVLLPDRTSTGQPTSVIQ